MSRVKKNGVSKESYVDFGLVGEKKTFTRNQLIDRAKVAIKNNAFDTLKIDDFVDYLQSLKKKK